jgi:hypothetical protein
VGVEMRASAKSQCDGESVRRPTRRSAAAIAGALRQVSVQVFSSSLAAQPLQRPAVGAPVAASIRSGVE